MIKLIPLVFLLFSLNVSVIAQWPWETLSKIEYSPKEVFSSGDYLIAYSYTKLLVTEKHRDCWRVIKDFNDQNIGRLAVSDTLIYVLLQEYGIKMVSGSVNATNWETYACNGITLPGELGQGISKFLIKDGIFFVGNNNGNIFKSTDQGHNWVNSSNGLVTGFTGLYCNQGEGIYALYTDGMNIYAGTNCHGIYYSSNDGETWQPMNNGIPMETKTRVYDIASNPEFIFARTNKGVYSSSNMGQSWQSAGNFPASSLNIEVFGNNICVLTSENLVFKSTDSGTSWEVLPAKLAIPGFDWDHVIAADSSGFYISEFHHGMFKLGNLDHELSTFGFGLTQHHAGNLFKSDSILISSSLNGGIYYSGNLGKTWSALDNALSGLVVNSIVQFDTAFAAATDNGIYYSLDNGLSWNTSENSLQGIMISDITFHKNQLFAATHTGIFNRDVKTDEWNEINSGLDTPVVNSLCSRDDILFACTAEGACFLDSLNQRWNPIPNSPHTNINSLEKVGDTLFLAGDQLMHVSLDNGIQWDEYLIDPGIHIRYLSSCNSDVFAATSRGIFYFKPVEKVWFNLFFRGDSHHLLATDSLLYASTVGGILTVENTRSLLAGIENVMVSDNIQVFPNPFDSGLTIKSEDPGDELLRIDFFSLNGSLITSEINHIRGSWIILNNLNSLDRGMYLMQMVFKDKVRAKLVIRK